MTRTILRSLAIIVLLGASSTAMAQSGHSVRTIATSDPLLEGDSLDIYFHVPESYDAEAPSKLIIGFHGLGNPDNSGQIRQYLTPLGDSINAIVMCPDPYLQDQPRSEVVLHLAYDSVLTWFNIDTAQIYIIGYSAGSDVAARYVFGEPLRFMKGLIWHSPGFFFNPDLSSPEEIPPVCLCTGTQDFTSILQTNLLNNNLNGSGIPYLYNVLDGVDHTMEYPAFTTEMLECIAFIDAQYSTGIEEQDAATISIFPNPVAMGEALTLSGSGAKVQVTVLDVAGRTVFNRSFEAYTGALRFESLAEQLGTGIFLVNVVTGQHSTTHRLVVQ
jgi:hypothetical protein